MRRVAATKQLICHPKLGKTQAQTVISPIAVRISRLKLYTWFTKAHCSLAAAKPTEAPCWCGSRTTPFSLMTLRSGCYRTHLTCELLAYASKNVNGDVPSDLQKRRGGKSIYTWPHQSSPWFSTQVLWDQSTRWEEPALPCRSAGIPAGQKRVRLICSRRSICKNAFFSHEDFQHCKTAFFYETCKNALKQYLLNSLLNILLITETDQLYISCQALSSV